MSTASTSDHLEMTLAEAGDWLTPEDAGLVGALRLTARALDRNFSDRTMAEYRQLLHDLHARKAQRIAELPPLERVRRFME